jgi:alpha-ketoglutarate-dependent taurine dioxygenase
MTSLDDVHQAEGKPPIVSAPDMTSMDKAVSWLTDNTDAIQTQLRTSGCLMIRGLPVTTEADFAAARDVLLATPATYKEKATPRSDFGHGVYSSTDLPPSQNIRLHNENSYTLEFPGTLLFGCLVAPDTGGATTVGDMREVLRLLPQALRDRFDETGWLMVRNYSEMAGLPWQTSFATDDPSVVEAYCADNTIGCEWLDDGSLRTMQRRSASIAHPETGDRSWFNHVAFWNQWTHDPEVREVLVDAFGVDGLPFATFFGDGVPVSEQDASVLNAAYDQVTVREPWRVGDLLLVDNILCAHGRDSYTGQRRIVVSMGNPVQLAACQPSTLPSADVYRA